MDNTQRILGKYRVQSPGERSHCKISDGDRDLDESNWDLHEGEIIEMIEAAASNNTNEY